MAVPFTHSILGLFSPTRRMRKDWDLRARENARHYIDCGHGGSDEEFWRSGQQDLEHYILRDLEIERSAAALEIGCGMGRLLRPLSARVGRTIGVDISGEMIRRAREALAGVPNLRLERTDGDLPGEPNASLDLVYSHIVFQHVPTKKAVSRYFTEAARVLKGGGVFRFQVDGRPPGAVRIPDTWNGVRYAAGDLRGELASAGFEVVDLTGEGTQYMWVTARRLPETGRPKTAAIRVRRRAWNPEELAGLLARLGYDPSIERERVVSGAVRLRDLTDSLIPRHRTDTARGYVTAVYRALLGREPDAAGLDFYAGEIERGIGRTNVVDCVLASQEFDAKHRT